MYTCRSKYFGSSWVELRNCLACTILFHVLLCRRKCKCVMRVCSKLTRHCGGLYWLLIFLIYTSLSRQTAFPLYNYVYIYKQARGDLTYFCESKISIIALQCMHSIIGCQWCPGSSEEQAYKAGAITDY